MRPNRNEPKGADDWARGVPTGTRGPMMLCAASTAVFLGGFLGWAATAPLSGAVIADGVVAAAGQNLRIQHLEGGIVRHIAAREGERVEPGQLLLTLDDTVSAANRNRIRAQLYSAMVRAERLQGERDGADALAFSAELIEAALSPDMVFFAAEQHREFEVRLMRFRQERSILAQRLASLASQRDGLMAQKGAVEEQLRVVREERERKRNLLERGLTNRSEYTALLRSEADLVGQSGQFGASILDVDVREIEAHEQIARVDTQRMETAAGELGLLRVEIGELQEQLRAAEDVLTRASLVSPTGGIVVRNSFNVAGGVVRPGDVLMEILPTTDRPQVEARIPVQSIDNVRVGQDVRLAFVALNARVTPEIAGRVSYVSADRLTDPVTNEPYFLARIEPTRELPEMVSAEQIYPGMPVQAFVDTGSRTFLEYLSRPILDSFNRAFRES